MGRTAVLNTDVMRWGKQICTAHTNTCVLVSNLANEIWRGAGNQNTKRDEQEGYIFHSSLPERARSVSTAVNMQRVYCQRDDVI